MEEAPENGKESRHSAHANGMNDSLSHVVFIDEAWHILMQQQSMPETGQR